VPEALSNDQVKIAELPIAAGLLTDSAVIEATARLLEAANQLTTANARMSDWLRQEFDTDPGENVMRQLTALNPDEFVLAVRAALPKGKRLTASDIAVLKGEYAETLEPAQQSRSSIAHLERRVSDLVNASYGLSSDDIGLLWKSAPPRMPYMEQGLMAEEAAIDDPDDEN
jgi:hypothetical protein